MEICERYIWRFVREIYGDLKQSPSVVRVSKLKFVRVGPFQKISGVIIIK